MHQGEKARDAYTNTYGHQQHSVESKVFINGGSLSAPIDQLFPVLLVALAFSFFLARGGISRGTPSKHQPVSARSQLRTQLRTQLRSSMGSQFSGLFIRP